MTDSEKAYISGLMFGWASRLKTCSNEDLFSIIDDMEVMGKYLEKESGVKLK